MLVELTGVSAELGENEGASLTMTKAKLTKIHVLGMNVALGFPEPSRSCIVNASGIVFLERYVVFVRIKLSPSLVEYCIINYRRMVIKLLQRKKYGVLSFLIKIKLFAKLRFKKLFYFLKRGTKK